METCPGQHWAAPNVLVLPCVVPTTKTLLQSIWEVTLSFLISNVVTVQKSGNVRIWISQIRTCNCHGCSCRVVPPPPCPKAALTAKDTSLTSSPREEELMNLHEPVMTDGCCPLLARKGKCCLEYFDMSEMSHGNSLLCIIKSPFQTEKITNIRIAIFSFHATICWVLVTTQRIL